MLVPLKEDILEKILAINKDLSTLLKLELLISLVLVLKTKK